MTSLTKLTQLMAALRDPQNGCPWDIKQTSKSIASYTLEETYELLHAIQSDDTENLKEELGDLLFHVVFHAQIAAENNQFDIDDIVQNIVDKMTRRHPHVFETEQNNKLSDSDLKKQWQQLKQNEKLTSSRILDNIGHKFPALIRAQKLQDAAAEYHFDWPDVAPVLDKIEEEIAELREAMISKNRDHIQDEMGDILFACTNLARHIDVDAEAALRQTNEKFIRRFDYVVKQMEKAGIELSPSQLEQMEIFWQQSKSVTG
ncbi:MAG: nucleoside triphosphate pyrophosphohydrolase [Gammaproteobacteria bacterium]|nr:nucleoside triphosphate pyrophosphohydrolase [Gammaproteobacteria bacterium]